MAPCDSFDQESPGEGRSGGVEEKYKRNYLRCLTTVVFREHNELIGEFKMPVGDVTGIGGGGGRICSTSTVQQELEESWWYLVLIGTGSRKWSGLFWEKR